MPLWPDLVIPSDLTHPISTVQREPGASKISKVLVIYCILDGTDPFQRGLPRYKKNFKIVRENERFRVYTLLEGSIVHRSDSIVQQTFP